MILILLALGFMNNIALASENIETNEQNVLKQEKKLKKSKVLDYGLDTEFEGYTLNEVINHKVDLNILLLEYNDKKDTFKAIGSLKDLNKYSKFKEHINKNEAVMCFDSILLDNNGHIVEFGGTIIDNTRETSNCTKFYKKYEQFLEQKVERLIIDIYDSSFMRSQGRDTARKLHHNKNCS